MNPNAPAFPNNQHEVHQVDKDVNGKTIGGHFENIPQAIGLSVRDYTAIEVMKGLLSNPEYLISLNRDTELDGMKMKDAIARHAYSYADALISESNKK